MFLIVCQVSINQREKVSSCLLVRIPVLQIRAVKPPVGMIAWLGKMFKIKVLGFFL